MNVYMGSVTAAVVATKNPEAELEGLQLVDHHIDLIISDIDAQLKEYKPDNFDREGFINNASFGGNDRAPAVAGHHEKAHRVMYRTLVGLKRDLENFRDACDAARKLLKGVDGAAAENLTVARQAVSRLDYGSWSNDGDRAYDDARNNRDGEDA